MVEINKSYTGEELRSQGFNPDITGEPQTVGGKTYILWNDQGKRRVEEYTASTQQRLEQEAADRLENEIANVLIEIDEALSQIPLDVTDAERDQLLQKAIEQVSPYYDKKLGEIQAGIREGKVRSAEDILAKIKEVRTDTEQALKGYDIRQAETEEEFIDTLANITATKEEELELARDDWRQRLETAKTGQVQTGVLTSGVGRKEISDLLARQQMEEQALERRAGAQATEAERRRKYELQEIELARESVRKERERLIGAPEEEAATTGAALATTGYGSLAELPSATELARLRAERNIPVYSPTALTELEEERKRAEESRRQELIGETRATRQAEAEATRKKILAEAAERSKGLRNYFAHNYLS